MTKLRKNRVVIFRVLLFIIAAVTVAFSLFRTIKDRNAIKAAKILCGIDKLPSDFLYWQILSFYTVVILGLISVIIIVTLALILKNKRISENQNKLIKTNRRICEYGAVAVLFISLQASYICAFFLLILESILIKIVFSQLTYDYNERNQENNYLN